MNPAKEPETELEYWLMLENLTSFVWRTENDFEDGRIENPDRSIKVSIMQAKEQCDKMLAVLEEKFGILHPNLCRRKLSGVYPPAPEGKRNYWAWYEEQKKIYWDIQYENMICSACAFSKGPQEVHLSVPCSLPNADMSRLRISYLCGMIDTGKISRLLLMKKLDEKGQGAKKKFLAKERELRRKSAVK